MNERRSTDYNLQFTEDRLAGLYDVFYPPARRDDFAFYLPLVMSAGAVLDVGCGTGALLHQAREPGHRGRLCGLDPASGMLKQARARSDIEWVLGDLSSIKWVREFDLTVMTGHAFQELTEDDELRAGLAAIAAALTEGGRFAFETRNPLARAWEHWATEYTAEVTDASGASVRCKYRVETPVVPWSGGAVCVSVWCRPVDRGAVRRLDPAAAQRDEPGDHHHRTDGLGRSICCGRVAIDYLNQVSEHAADAGPAATRLMRAFGVVMPCPDELRREALL
jgi:SAM-dependent methyltransferase